MSELTWPSGVEECQPFRDQITTLDSAMSFDRRGDTPYVAVVGRLVNNSPHPWQDVQVEVQYFDSSDELIDTGRGTMDFGVILAGDEKAFKIANPHVASLGRDRGDEGFRDGKSLGSV